MIPKDANIYKEVPDENWRPSKSDLAELHAAWGASRKERNADLHLYCWLNFGKGSTKELTYQEFTYALDIGNILSTVEYPKVPEEAKAIGGVGGEVIARGRGQLDNSGGSPTSPAFESDQRPKDSM